MTDIELIESIKDLTKIVIELRNIACIHQSEIKELKTRLTFAEATIDENSKKIQVMS